MDTQLELSLKSSRGVSQAHVGEGCSRKKKKLMRDFKTPAKRTHVGMTGFLSASAVKDQSASAGDAGSAPGSGRSPGEGHGNPLQYYRMKNPVDRGAWRATVPGVPKSQTEHISKQGDD